MPAEKNPGSPTAGVPKSVCPSCKTANDMGAVTCKKCGEFLTAKKAGVKKTRSEEEFDATEGGFSPTCIIVPAVLLLAAVVFFFLAVGHGPKAGTCEFNQAKIGKAVYAYNRAHTGSKMTTLNWEELAKPGKGGKAFLKDRLTCPVDPSASYSLADDGSVRCSKCTK